MAAGDTTITMIGNLVDDPELRFTPSGAAVAKFRVASTPRYLDKATNEWKDGDAESDASLPLFHRRCGAQAFQVVISTTTSSP